VKIKSSCNLLYSLVILREKLKKCTIMNIKKKEIILLSFSYE